MAMKWTVKGQCRQEWCTLLQPQNLWVKQDDLCRREVYLSTGQLEPKQNDRIKTSKWQIKLERPVNGTGCFQGQSIPAAAESSLFFFTQWFCFLRKLDLLDVSLPELLGLRNKAYIVTFGCWSKPWRPHSFLSALITSVSSGVDVKDFLGVGLGEIHFSVHITLFPSSLTEDWTVLMKWSPALGPCLTMKTHFHLPPN